MATPTDSDIVRLLAGVTSADYDEDFIEELIDRGGNGYGAVSLLWQIRAAAYAKEVSAASGTTRIDLQQRYEHCIERAQYYEGLAGGIADGSGMTSVKMAAAIEDTSTEYTWDSGWPRAGIWAVWERL